MWQTLVTALCIFDFTRLPPPTCINTIYRAEDHSIGISHGALGEASRRVNVKCVIP